MTAAPLERFTGVLFRALDVDAWSRAERNWAARHLLVHVPDRGLVEAAGDGDEVADLDLLAASSGPLIDLRSQEYVRKIAAPAGSWAVRIVSDGSDGRRLAVSHWNKHHKGVVVRELVRDRPKLGGIQSLLGWAERSGVRLERTGPTSLDLVV